MWRVLAILVSSAMPAIAAETDDRTEPVFYWGAVSSPPLQALHLPETVISGGKLFRMTVSFSSEDGSLDETYIIETNEDGRPATVRFEVEHSPAKGKGRDKFVTGKRGLTETELAEFRAAFQNVRICSTAADGPTVFDAGSMHIEFVDEERYCFASRSGVQLTAPEFDNLSDVVRGFSGLID